MSLDANVGKSIIFFVDLIAHLAKELYLQPQMVDVAQPVRASVCGAEGRGFEPHLLPKKKAGFSPAFFRL